MNKPQILVVEDDVAIGNLITTTLETQNYQYHKARTGAAAILEAASSHPDVILLDLGLPDMDGVDIIKKVRSWSNTPIIVVSARSEDMDKVSALDAGADDYLTKPYDLEVFVARVEARLRGSSDSRRYVTYGCLRLDTVSLTGFVNGRDIQLTQKEFTVLLLLAQNAERRVPSSELAREVWGAGSEQENNALWTLVSRLRKKLRSDESRLEIASLRGGYLLEQL